MKSAVVFTFTFIESKVQLLSLGTVINDRITSWSHLTVRDRERQQDEHSCTLRSQLAMLKCVQVANDS